MSKDALNPAHYVIVKLGGEEIVNEHSGIPLGTLWRWQRPSDRGGTDGAIPRWRWEALHNVAKTVGVSLTDAELAGVSDQLKVA